MEHRLTIDNDFMAPQNLVAELDQILSPLGIHLEIENEEHDGFDVCIVKIDEKTSEGAELIAAERKRQIEEEGWTAEHDDQHTNWARKHAKKEFPKQLEKLEVFERMVKQIGHRRIVLVAKAASGKDFLRNRLTARNLKPSISITTRPPRPGEVDGKDYIFTTESKVEQMIENDEFYEYVRFNAWLYGTTKQQFNEDDVFIMTPAGIAKIKPEDRKNCFVIFLDIPEEVRRARLLERTMPGDTVDRRIAADEEDFRNFKDYDMRVTNPDF